MKYLEEKTSNVSILVENQFPSFVRDTNEKFINFISSYYESQEGKYQPLDIASNLIDYYNIGYYRPSRLVKNTKLIESGNLSDSVKTITVESTVGFPETNGYIKIDDEIIFYTSKTKTQFLECERGVSALVLDSVPKSNIFLTNSTAAEHKNLVDVKNIAYDYANEFLSRIKSELSPLIPEVLDESLDLASFIKNIKSFYSSKGSLNSHKILFRILFNDRKFNIKLKKRGSGAKLKINSSIPKIIQAGIGILDGGDGYDNRKDGGILVNPPIIDILGSGVGSIDPTTKTRKNKTAIVEVTDIDSNGSISAVSVIDTGESYIGAITARVRPTNFGEDELVQNLSGTGSGRVEYYDAYTDELILDDVVGYFLPNEEIYSNAGEKARAFISQSYISPSSNRNGLRIDGEEQQIEFPKNYTFKTSNSTFTDRKIIKCKLIDGYFLQNNILPDVISLVQNRDSVFGVSGVVIEVDNNISLSENIYEFDITTNTDINKIFLPPSTVVTKQITGINSSTTNFVLTVDEVTRFPVTNGIVSINGNEIFYKYRSAHQLFDCSYSGSNNIDFNVKDEVISVARLKENTTWTTNTIFSTGDYVFYNDNLYLAKNSGTSGITAPSHTNGTEYDGTIVNANPILWEYAGKNKLDHTFYIDYNNSAIVNPKFQLLGLPGDIVIQDGGSLHNESTYSFARFDSPNVQAYAFTTAEISDRLSAILASNNNRTRDSIIETSNNTTLEIDNIKSLNSYQSLTGFSSQYDFEEYIYVSGSGIPRWWEDIVDFNTTLSVNDKKKVAFTNQRLLTRWNKSGLLSDTQAVGVGRKNKKLVGLNIDAVQINSYKGNTVSYGQIKNFYIGDGGDYPVLYTEDSNGFGYSLNESGLPKFGLTDSLVVGSEKKLVKISSSLKSIDFNKLAIAWSPTSNLSGFSKKPEIDIVNNNPQISVLFTDYSGLNVTTKVVTSNNHGLETSLKVTLKILQGGEFFAVLRNNTEYFVRVIDDNTFTLHRTKAESLLNSNSLALNYLLSDASTPAVSNPNFKFISEQLNPPYFREAKLDLSYKNGIIDGIIVRDSGEGYVSLPTITISGGGKLNGVDVPFSLNSDRIVNFSGPLVSYYNFYKDNYNELQIRSASNVNDGFKKISKIFAIAPSVEVEFGDGAKAIAYTSNGSITSLSLINEGSGYNFPPKVVITGNGKDAVVNTTISGGKVTGFIIINGGSGYTISPNIEIQSSELKKSIVSSKLNEWTFNLVRQLNKLDRIDSYGGYVYDDSDAIPPKSNNPKNFRLIDYQNDFPRDLDEKQYYLLQNTKKLSAKYLKEKAPDAVKSAAETASGKLVPNMTDDEVLQYFIMHTIPIGISYDSVPTYCSGYILAERNKPVITDSSDANYVTQFTTAKSRYRLKYDEVASGTTGAITLTTTDGTKYVTLSRIGGPSINDYPIGTFIEDYEYVEGTDDNDLDEHNGRFTVTPEFPTGRYCYFTTLESYDSITNALVDSVAAENNNIGFNGFPYFVGDTFASSYDDYMNNRCRRNDKIPSVFTRSFEKDIDPIINDGIQIFPGLDHNDEYPKENINVNKTIAKTVAISPGSVDSVIIESKGDNYRVGDRLVVDNNLTSGSGFSAIVAKVGGKSITNISISNDELSSTFTTDVNHNISVNDFVYFDYIQGPNEIEINLYDNHLSAFPSEFRIIKIDDIILDAPSSNIDIYKNFEFYEINVNFKYKYKLNIPAGADFLLTYDLEKTNEFFTLEKSPTDAIIINALNIPNRLYLHIGSRIYQINKTRDYFGIQKITSITSKTFTIKTLESSKGYETVNISYTAKSYGAVGPIEQISITSSGSGYKKLPTVSRIIKKGTVDTEAGNGKAIVQTNSNTIGKIKKLSYSSVGSSITSNKNVNHYLNISSTAKVINNFEIYDIEIINGGENYDNVVTILVNGLDNLTVLEASVYLGIITSIKIIDGGMNFTEEPILTVSSTYGSGAVLKPKIRRKQLFPEQILTGEVNSLLFPIKINIDVVAFDVRSSTLEFNENSGQFKNGDFIYVNGKKYGKIESIRRSKAFSKVRSYSKLQIDSPDISGRTSESLQKITDSNYYQEWSYSLTSSRDIKEWRYEQDINTHPAGFKQFGKKLIERRKSFFKNPLDVFKSSVTFATKISRSLDLSLKLSPCGKQRIFLQDVSGFTVSSYIVGATSEAIGRINSITESSLIIESYNNKLFLLDEIVVQVSSEFAFGISDATNKSFNFWNGIFQEPGESYEVSENPIAYVPHYIVDNSDEITLYNFDDSTEKTVTSAADSGQSNIVLDNVDGINVGDIVSGNTSIPNITTVQSISGTTITLSKNLTSGINASTNIIEVSLTFTQFVRLDNQVLNTNQTSFSFNLQNASYPVTSSILDEFIISIGGVIQNPANLTVSANAVVTSQLISNDSNVIAVRHTNLSTLTFTGTGTTYQINQTPSSNCKLLIFREGISQTHLLTDYSVSGDIVTFSESIPPNELFGWYYDGTINCQVIDGSVINQNKIIKQLPCEKTTFLEKIESNSKKKPELIYEIRKESIDGTIVPVSSTKVEGFDTKFTYTSPSHSDSYVEVIDAISFNGSTQSFQLKTNSENYITSNGEESLIVYIDDDILDHDQYSVSGSTINFSQVYASTKKCTILDFVSGYSSNTNNENCAIIDRLNVAQNGSRTTFNLSDRGVPKYVRNVGDIFKIKNNKLERPDSQTQSVNDNKITFVTPPINSDDINLIYFNRQLQPVSTNNVMFDDLYCFNGVRTSFPFAIDGAISNYTSVANLHLYMLRNGVMQKPGVDYVLAENSNTGTWQINFSESPTADEEGKIFAWFSYNNLTKNQRLDFGNYVNGIRTKFALTRNYQALPISNNNNILVFRNGVHQEFTTTYTILNNPNNTRIIFDTAPQTTEEIFIFNIVNSDVLSKTASSCSQVNSNTISTNFSSLTTNNFIIFVNGVKQNPNSAYTVTSASSLYTFNFTDDVSLSTDKVSIYAYGGSAPTMFNQCDEITVSNISTLTYNITSGGLATTPYTDSGILVAIDGIVQEYGIAYTTSGSTITFTPNATLELGDKIDMITIGGGTNEVDYIDDNYNKIAQTTSYGTTIKPNRYKLGFVSLSDPTDKYEPYNPSIGFDSADVMVIRSGVVQNPTEDYIIGHGYIEFTTNVTELEDLYLLYVHSRDELSFTQTGSTSNTKTYQLSNTLSSIFALEDDIIVFADGVPRFKRKGDFIVTNDDTITLTHADGLNPTQVFITKYPTLLLLDVFENCPNGTRTIFNLYQNENNWSVSEVSEDADILISKNGIILDPGTEYNLISNNRQVDFTTPPVLSDTIFFVKMNGNELKSLTNVSGNTYNLVDTYSSNYDKEGLVIFSNNVWKFAETGGFTWNDNNTITLDTTHTSGTLFAIKFNGVFNLLDEIHTPFDGSRTMFNMFDGEENFMPPGTVSDDSTPDPTSLLVTKNGGLLEPGYQYTLTGDNESQIQFTSAPVSSDVISVRSVGSFDKLDTIASGSGTVFPLTKSSNDYYPNAHIERPRELENQIIVIKDGKVLSPLYDFYIDNNNIVFVNSVSGSRLSFLDFRGTASDVKVFSRLNQLSVGDELYISGEENIRYVEGIESPTVMNTREMIKNGNFIIGNTYKIYKLDGNQVNIQTTDSNGDTIWVSIGVGDIFTATTTSVDGIVSVFGQGSLEGNTPSGFVATTNYSGGIVTGFTMTNGGEYYENPVVIRTKGTGSGAKAVARVKTLIGDNVVDASSIELQYPGRNVYNDHTAIATVYATTYKKQPLHKSEVRKSTKLNTALTNSSTTVVLGNSTGLSSNPPVVTVTSNSGTVAQINNVKVFNGKITGMEILSAGSSMDDRDVAITVTGGGGSGCVLEPVLNVSGMLTGINIQNPGTGYDSHRVIILNGTDEKEEVIEYTGITSNTLTGITRGVVGTSASSHQTTGTSVYFDNYL
tara:strand:+ start:8852 stop:20620 length:11769 start_codon:yes stop_codon:yes gene_type:complete